MKITHKLMLGFFSIIVVFALFGLLRSLINRHIVHDMADVGELFELTVSHDVPELMSVLNLILSLEKSRRSLQEYVLDHPEAKQTLLASMEEFRASQEELRASFIDAQHDAWQALLAHIENPDEFQSRTSWESATGEGVTDAGMSTKKDTAPAPAFLQAHKGKFRAREGHEDAVAAVLLVLEVMGRDLENLEIIGQKHDQFRRDAAKLLELLDSGNREVALQFYGAEVDGELEELQQLLATIALDIDEEVLESQGVVRDLIQDALASINREERLTRLALSVGLLLSIGAGYFTSKMISGPIISLKDAAVKIEQGEPDARANVNSRDEVGILAHAFNRMVDKLKAEQEKSEHLLLNILPEPIVDRLKEDEGAIADGFAEVTVLFADIVNFTEFSAQVPPTQLVNLLNEIFSTFDELADRHGLEKIKTIGDAYMVVGGLPTPRADHTEAVAEMALDMQAEIARFSRGNGESFRIRVGINTGPVVAGVIGHKKFIYDLWGDTVNVASRMESQGLGECIQVTPAVFQRLRDKYEFEERGEIQVKGKGTMRTYLLKGRNGAHT